MKRKELHVTKLGYDIYDNFKFKKHFGLHDVYKISRRLES